MTLLRSPRGPLPSAMIRCVIPTLLGIATGCAAFPAGSTRQAGVPGKAATPVIRANDASPSTATNSSNLPQPRPNRLQEGFERNDRSIDETRRGLKSLDDREPLFHVPLKMPL